MNCYSVSWKDREGNDHSQLFTASSASAAIALSLEKIVLLRENPNLITRVLLEETNGK